MPRQRTARLPLLSSPVRAPEGVRPRSGAPVRARIVALALVLVSLALITLYFRESSAGVLHEAQRIGASALAPFEVAAERVARPFRDARGYVSDVFRAKSENARLRKEVETLRQQAIQNSLAAEENEKLRAQLEFVEGPHFPAEFGRVSTRVIQRPVSVYNQSIFIAAGFNHGVRKNDPVVTEEGLVGIVTEAMSKVAKVRLITDQQNAVAARIRESGASGVVRHGPSETAPLILDRVPREELVREGDTIVTAGWRTGRWPSLYPRGILIGKVTAVSRRDVDPYTRIQVTPFVDFDALDEVIVLTARKRDP